MKRLKRHSVGLAVLVLWTMACSVSCERKPAQIFFPQTEIDLGTVFTDDAIHTVDVEFQNTGGEKLVISSVWPSCDCVTVERFDSIVGGGKKGKISLRYNFSIYPPGDIERFVTVTSNSVDTTDHEVYIHAFLKYAH